MVADPGLPESCMSSSATKEVIPIKKLSRNEDKMAVEAVLSCIAAHDCHLAPHGTLSLRLQQAEDDLKKKWNFSLSGL